MDKTKSRYIGTAFGWLPSLAAREQITNQLNYTIMARILAALKKAKEIEARKFTEKDLRGLTNAEKEFIRDNDYNVCVSTSIDAFGRRKQKLYMFIARQRNGRKALYAITKWQSVYPGGRDFAKGVYNYQCWMTFSKKDNGFSSSYHEFRFCDIDNSE